jgi:hypothetical protein
MPLAEVNANVGPDGVLTCSIPVGLSAANRRVRITIAVDEPTEIMSIVSAEDWWRFIDETAGSIADPTFGR